MTSKLRPSPALLIHPTYGPVISEGGLASSGTSRTPLASSNLAYDCRDTILGPHGPLVLGSGPTTGSYTYWSTGNGSGDAPQRVARFIDGLLHY